MSTDIVSPFDDLSATQTPRVGQHDVLPADVRNRLLGAGVVKTVNIQDAAITNAKIVSLSASKITAGTVNVGVNIGSSSILIDGANANGGRIIFYNSGTPAIVIGSTT